MTENIQELFAKEETSLPAQLIGAIDQGRFILYGAGGMGGAVIKKLKAHDHVPIAVADDTPSRQGQSLEGIPIFSLSGCKEKFGDIPVIITIFQPSVSFPSMKEKVEQQGFSQVYSLLQLYHSFPAIFLPFYQFADRATLSAGQQELEKVFKWLDPGSQKIFLANLRFRLGVNHADLPRGDHEEYFPADLFPGRDEGCIYIDCGAYDGDTIRKFTGSKAPARIHAFEPDPANYSKIIEYAAGVRHENAAAIYVHQMGIGRVHGYVRFASTGTMGSALDENGNMLVQVTSLDELLLESLRGHKAVYIKYDIEGEEMNGLEGAKKIIGELAPHLAISIYHKPDDLWKIPMYLKELNPAYNFFLRQHGEDGMDLVLYAAKH